MGTELTMYSVRLVLIVSMGLISPYVVKGYRIYIPKDCECFNPFLGGNQEFAGDAEYTRALPEGSFCFVPCDSDCRDKSEAKGFLRGKCKSSKACDKKSAKNENSQVLCECLDLSLKSKGCPKSKCFVDCASGCDDVMKGPKGRCVSRKACKK